MVYIGYQFTPKGVKLDPQKIEAIVNMPELEDMKNVETLLEWYG